MGIIVFQQSYLQKQMVGKIGSRKNHLGLFFLGTQYFYCLIVPGLDFLILVIEKLDVGVEWGNARNWLWLKEKQAFIY